MRQYSQLGCHPPARDSLSFRARGEGALVDNLEEVLGTKSLDVCARDGSRATLMFWLEKRSSEVLRKRELEDMRGWTHVCDGRGCGDLLSDREVYLRTVVLSIYTPTMTII